MGSRAALVVSAVPDNADSPMRLAQVVETTISCSASAFSQSQCERSPPCWYLGFAIVILAVSVVQLLVALEAESRLPDDGDARLRSCQFSAVLV